MAEYIKKEDLLNEAYWHGDRYTVQNPYPTGVEAVDVEDIEKMETINIVKCGECKHSELDPNKTVFVAMVKGRRLYEID